MTINSQQSAFDGIKNSDLKPVIKWAGGKTKLNPELIKATDIALELLKKEKLDYYEPFFGGGALFFELHKHEKINKAHINDTIPQLVSFYETISKKDWINEFFSEVELLSDSFEKGNQKELYGSAKKDSGWVKDFNDLWKGNQPENKTDKIKSAALFLILNKTGFNGMFRLNKEGKFNIPKGDTKKVNFNDSIKENFKNVSLILSNTSIHCGSYEQILPPKFEINKNTSFIYLDPPYVPDSKTADFTDYSKEGFKEKDHDQVADIFHQLAEDGYKVLLSNNSNEESKEKYAKNKKVFAYEIMVSRAIAKMKEGKRPPTKELLVSSFDLGSLNFQRL